jgi:hypothetical protein
MNPLTLQIQDHRYIKDLSLIIPNNWWNFVVMRLTDTQIQALISEPKRLPDDFITTLRKYKDKGSHQEAKLEIKGDNNTSFIVFIRKSRINPLDFSVIFACRLPQTNIIFRIKRYNGKHSSPHTNKIEGQRFQSVCHIHTATERDQLKGWREEDYAEPTDRYTTIEGAILCLIQDCNFIPPNGRFLLEGGS